MSWQEADRCQAADNNDEEQVVQSISVSVKKSCFDEHGINLGELLEKIQEKQRERKHVVDVEKLANGHHLKGCFCGIKAVREELQKILKEKMKQKQEQDEIRNKEKQLQIEQTMLTETNEAKRQNISNKKLLAKTTHFVPIDKDVYDYLALNYHGELKELCSSIEECESNSGFAIKIELNTNEDVETITTDISALTSHFVVREHKVPEEINFRKFQDKVNVTQTKNNAVIVFDGEQKTVKVIGSPKEAGDIMQQILTLSASQRFDVKDEVVTKNAIEKVNEQTYKHHDKRGATKEETKRDEKKTLIDDTESECSDRRGTTKGDSLGDDNKTLTDDTKPQHPDKQDTTKDDTKGDKKALIADTNSEHQHTNIKATAETKWDDKKTLNDSTKSENPDKQDPTTDETKDDDKETSTDDCKSYPDKGGASTDDTMGYDKKTVLDDTKSEHQAKKGITKDDSKGDDDKPLNEDTTSKHQERKVTANDEATGHDKKTLNDYTKAEYQNKKDPTTDETNEDDQQTADDGKSYPGKNGTSQDDTLGYNKKILTDYTKSEYPDKEVTTKDEAKDHCKNTPIGNTKSEHQDKQDRTADNTTGDDDKTLTNDTTAEHPNKKGASKLTIKKIDAKNTMLGHDSMRVSAEESNVKLDINEKGEADDKDKEISLDKEAIKFSKTGNKSEYDNKSQGIQSPGAAITGSYPLQQPTKPRNLLHRILMDEDAYRYIQRFLNEELEDVTALCNSVQELRDKASNFYLGFTVKYEVEDEMVRRRFQMLIDQVKVEEYKAPEVVNASDLESVVHASDKSEATMTFVESEKNSLKIVGRPDKVDRLKKHIEETVSEQLLSQKQLSKENTHTYYSEQPCKQQSGRKCYYHIPIDKNLYTYLSTHCQKEMEQASEHCTSITASEKGSAFTIDFELQDKRDEGFVKRIFEKLIGQFKSEECRVMKGIDIALIEAANTLKEVMIFPQEDKQLLKLIGPKAQVSKTKKWIDSLISDTIQSELLSKRIPQVTNPNVYSSPIRDQPQSSKQSIPLASTSLQKGNPVDLPRKPSELFKITSTTSDSLTYESKRVKNQLTVRVHFANIIKQNTDVLVSYDDERLQGCTFLAIAMKEAAGPDVERELANISKNHGPLEVGRVVHTGAGKLRPSVKYLVHAVRAQHSQHHPEDPKTFEILYKTFLNCLKYTNDKICQKSISIPPIGARKYGVQMVSAAFNQAVEDYNKIAEATRSVISLRSIHFVDQDPVVVRQMITSIKSFIE